MLNQIRRFLSNFLKNNKEKILKTAMWIAIMLLVSLSFGAFLKNNKLNNKNDLDSINTIYRPSIAIISDEIITNEQFNQESELIYEFLNSCNSSDVNNAYQLISDDCKQYLYPTIEEFEELYLKVIFTEKKIFNIQCWISDNGRTVYKVRILDDILTTGDYNSSKKFQDFITVNNETNKIGINGFIETKEINKTTNSQNIEINILKNHIFVDNEIFDVQVNNISDNDIVLTQLNDSRDIYLSLNENVKCYLNRNAEPLIKQEIKSKSYVNLKLEFKKDFNKNLVDDSIVLSNVLVNKLNDEFATIVIDL